MAIRKAKKIKKCPKCNCEGTITPSLARGFQKCIECRHIIATRKIKKVLTKTFGIANKSLDQAIARLDELKKMVPEGATAKIQQEYNYGNGNGNYKMIVESQETDEDVLERMLKAEVKAKEKQEKDEKEKKRRDDQVKKITEQRKRQQKQKELKLKRKEKENKKRKEKEDKLDAFFKQHGLSIAEVKEVLNG
jgi:hypothetical protein